MVAFEEDRVRIPFGAKHLDAALCFPASVEDADTALILTHGAGGDMNFRPLVRLSQAGASGGLLCLRFTCKALNLAYRVKAYRAVWDYLMALERFSIQHIFVGGRSMGCRAAAALARELSSEWEESLRGVVCLSFPLHPPAQTHAHRQRSEDLRGLPEGVAVLFVSGSEDRMCDKVLFDDVVKDMKARVDVFWLEGGSHGLTVRRQTEDSVLDKVNEHVVSWIQNQRTRSHS